MEPDRTLKRTEDLGLLAVVRGESRAGALEVVGALIEGGVSLGNIVDWFAAGAFAVGAGGALAPSSFGGRDRGEVVENARRCAEAVRAAREQ